MAIQIGKYKRPGIFIEEFDKSIISSPVVEGITNLVIGVSKKGPINTPIQVTTISEFESIFGQLDRSLERKASFFHRTISKMLETSPVFAMNLLYTDDELDKIEYQSLSAASGYDNDIEREGPYRRFFDTTGFWKRDTESFINLTKNNSGYSQRALSITNMSDRYVSVFIFKSKVTGFDRTLLEWYGSIEKMPPYVSSLDYASDYLVDVVIVAGDWSNYQELAVDSRWSAYFNSSGLRKDQVRNFANDRNVTTLAYYEGLSLIPYFRDLNGRNIFIETTLNRDTDKTGVFCAFNNDLVEKDYYSGLLDLVGNTLVDTEETSINFLSYKETITESVKITNTPLDLPGNVTAMFNSNIDYGTYSYGSQNPHAFQQSPGDTMLTSGLLYQTERTAWYAEGSVYGVDISSVTPTVSGGNNIEITYNISSDAFVVVGDKYVPISGTSVGSAVLDINSTDYTYSTTTASYVSALVVDNTGVISVVNSTSTTAPSVNSTDTVLGYVTFSVASQLFVNVGDVQNISVNTSGFNDLVYGTSSTDDYYISEVNPGSNDGKIKVEFIGTNEAQSLSNYKQYRRFKLFNRLVSLIDNPNKDRMSLMINPNTFEKYSFENIQISDIVYNTTLNKSFVLSTGLTSTQLTYILNGGYFVIYTNDNEFILGEEGVSTKNTEATTTDGVVAKYSNFYQKYYDGLINTKDFFYSNRLYLGSSGGSYDSDLIGTSVDVVFIDGESAPSGTSSYAGNDYIVFYSEVSNFDTQINLQVFEQLQFPDSEKNKGSFTIVANSVNPSDSPVDLATDLGYLGGNYYAYQVNEEVEFEQLNDVVQVNDYLVRHYLKMYLDNSNNLQVSFLDNLLQVTQSVDSFANNTFYIQSEKSNYKQTLELELPTGYVQVPNKVLVNGERYTEVKVGDFLEAYYDSTALQTGEFPRKFTRILSKRQYAADPTLTEITCDSRIATRYSGGALQTTRYSTIDQYATTYKTISLKGFRIRQDSLPDGTESRQSQILSLVGKGTPLFKALTNKEAIDFRYLIDSFGLGLTERSKQDLVDICGERLDCFGFINMPSSRSFKNSSSPSFTNSAGVLQTEFIAKGGDPESSPAFLYSFAEGAGTTCVGYFFPYVNINDNGRPLDHPPAPFVATTYMRKHIGNIGNVTPWTIAAGVTNGRITGINGLEQDLTLSDIENLNQAQINPLVFKRNRGYVIETENTAQTLYKSALSYIHVREVLIELERELSRMLLDFQWRFNTPDIRSEIKLRADVICETYVSKNGLYNYFNKMDDENNTPEIIDNQIGVLDTYVEPIKGMGIIVNNITILRTGAIAAGGFING